MSDDDRRVGVKGEGGREVDGEYNVPKVVVVGAC